MLRAARARPRPGRGTAPPALLLLLFQLLLLESELPHGSAAELGLAGAVHTLHQGCRLARRKPCALLCLREPEACPFHTTLRRCKTPAGSEWASEHCPEAILSQFRTLREELTRAKSKPRSAAPSTAGARAWATEPCAVPANPQAEASIVWPAAAPRPVWKDPGFRACPVPKGLDAGTCVEHGGEVHCLPSFVIIGVQKAATRELTNWLGLHKQLAAPGRELHFLNSVMCPDWDKPTHEVSAAHAEYGVMCGVHVGATRQAVNRRALRKTGSRAGPSPDFHGFWRKYSSYFPSPQAARKPGITLTPESKYYFEKTPNYIMMEEESVEKLHSLFPSMRLIVQLRNPIDRMYSWFYMYCGAPGAMSVNFFEVLAPGPDLGRVFELNTHYAAERPAEYRSVRCTPEAFERLVSVPTSADPTVRAMACTDGRCSWDTAAIELSAPSDLRNPNTNPKFARTTWKARGHYAELLRKWWRHFPRRQVAVVHGHLMFKYPVATMQRMERFLGLDPDDWSTRFRNSSHGTATLADVTSKVEKHESPQPMLERTRALLHAYFAPLNKDLHTLLCGASNDPEQADCEGFADVYPFP